MTFNPPVSGAGSGVVGVGVGWVCGVVSPPEPPQAVKNDETTSAKRLDLSDFLLFLMRLVKYEDTTGTANFLWVNTFSFIILNDCSSTPHLIIGDK